MASKAFGERDLALLDMLAAEARTQAEAERDRFGACYTLQHRAEAIDGLRRRIASRVESLTSPSEVAQYKAVIVGFFKGWRAHGGTTESDAFVEALARAIAEPFDG